MTPEEQAADEVRPLVDEQRKQFKTILDQGGTVLMPVLDALEMCELLMTQAWVRGYNARTEKFN